ncbi:helix-turn-helix transcriptional regulator [Pontibacter sp. H259]|uniref:helix-turn-helix domain-containing protein n=1 Tax=Pontibacter sp. H259 TaxID=3133421 RepID=UPI0030BD8958
MIERIQQLMEFLKLSSSQFADSVELPRAVLSHIMSGRNKPSLDVMLKLAAKYKEVNLEWLLLGEGEMLKKVANNPEPESVPKPAKSETAVMPEPDAVYSLKEGKVQTNFPPEGFSVERNTATKQLKQIIFFYSDNSFSVFKHEV